MTDTGQVPGEGLPESAGRVEQPGVPAPAAYTFLDPSENPAEDDDLLLMPGAQGAWSEAQTAQPGTGTPVAQDGPQFVQQSAGQQQPAQQPLGQVPFGQEATGQEALGLGVPGQSAPGQDNLGLDSLGQNSLGQDLAVDQAAAMDQPSVAPAQAAVDQAVAAAAQTGRSQPGQPVFAQAQAVQEQAAFGQEQVSGPQAPQSAHASAAQERLAHQPGPHETSGRDSGSVDLSGVPLHASHGAPAAQHSPIRRPLHRGPAAPAVPDGAASPVRSLADRGPAGGTPHPMPVRHAGPPTAGPEYLDIPRDDADALPGPQLGEIPPHGATPWTAQPQGSLAAAPERQTASPEPQTASADPQGTSAETVVPEGAAAPETTETTPAPQVPGLAPDLSGGAPAPSDPAAPSAPSASTDGSAPSDGTVQADAPAIADGSAPANASDPSDAASLASVPRAPGVMEASGALDATDAPHAPVDAPDSAEAPTAPSAHAPDMAAAARASATTHVAVAGTASGPSTTTADSADPSASSVTADATTDASAPQSPPPESAPAVEPPPRTDHSGTDRPGSAEQALPDDTVAPPSAPESLTAPGPELLTLPAPEAATTQQAAPAEATETPQTAPAEAIAAPGTAPAANPALGTPVSGMPFPAAPVDAQDAAVPHVNGQAVPAAHLAPVHAGARPMAAVAPQAPDAAQPWPEAHAAQGPHIAGAARMPDAAGAGQPFAEAQVPMPVGQFVPVEGSVPTTPHLAPTPPRPLSVPPEYFEPEQQPEQPQESRDPDAPAPQTAEPTPAPAAVPPVPAQGLPDQADAAPGAEPEADPAPGTPGTPGTLREAGQQPAATVPAPRDGGRPTAVPAGEAPAPVDAAEDGTPFPSAPETTDHDEPMHVSHPAGPTDPASRTEQPAVTLIEADEPEDLSTPAGPADADGLPQALLLDEDPEAGQEPAEPLAAALAADAPVEPPAPGYADAEREAVLRVMRERRDIRNGFRGDPIPHEVLLRVLEAAHTAPSVGHSQPWDFVVIKSAETRRTVHELARRQREAYAKSLPKGRAKQFKELKIEAILDTPVNIVVTADPTRGGRHTLGRHTQPQMAPYSSALAVENLWLAARAEGLGVGWVSFFDEREMVRALGLPEHLEVVAYLCVGYVDEFPDEPELMQAGWSKRRPLSWVVHEETYGRRALPGEDPHDLLAETVGNIRPLDAKALGEAWERQKRMTKPPGALGMLEIISAQLSGLSRMCPPPIPEPAAVAIFAGDHGVHAQGVTSWPQEVTGQMVANFLGGGAVCNAFANQVGAEVCVIDVGVASELPATPGLLPRKVRAGTADMTTGPALTRDEVKAAIEVGIETARDLVAAGNKALLTGEMGIANTTVSAALISVYTDTDPAEVTGRGTGINDEMHARKVEVVRRALDLHQPDPADPIGVLAAVGGLEHAAMVGLLLGGASLRTPVILDGVSAGAAALVARAIAPEVLAACIAGHRSAEPGHVAALNKLGLRPLVDLDLRLGEGTGALLALPVVQSAARAMHEVATFDSAGVTEK
ncbi:nicotinate-nucleotide--dimethylbenzimidazole phosphoribosyltransferase [Streptomyces lasiicapitis]|uniref:nicotinate-nucleotide--dimethylbenzimidazole phosphoribosyltransferase n=1 Tax=Streptomyces lasiicapitis TaxID=1923961 RepID=UPI0036CD35E7